MATKGTALRYITATGLIGYGYVIEHAGCMQHSIAWPDKPANRFKEDELAEHGIKYGDLFPLSVNHESKLSLEDSDEKKEDSEIQATQLESEAEAVNVETVEFHYLESETESNNIRNYITAYPKASNQEVIAGLNGFGLEVSSGQVAYNRKRLAELATAADSSEGTGEGPAI